MPEFSARLLGARRFMFLLGLALLWDAPLGGSARAQVEARTFSLNWVRGEGAEQCASSQLLARAIEQLLGPVLHSASDADVAIEGSVSQTKPGTFEVRTRVMSPRGDVIGARSFQREATDCAALTPAILLVLTLTLDPAAAAHGFPTELLARMSSSEDPAAALLAELDAAPTAPSAAPARSVPERPAAVSARADKAAPARSAPRASRWGGALQAGPVLAFALQPELAAGAHLAGELRSPYRLALLLDTSYFAPTTKSFDSFGSQRDVRFSAFHAQLSACMPLLPESAWQLSACAGGVLGLRWVDASELQHEADARRPYGGPVVQLSVRYAFSERWYASLDVAGALLFRRDRFTYQDLADETQLLFQPEAGAVWSSLSVGVRL